MNKIFSMLTALILVSLIPVSAQVVSLDTYGVNPREVAKDTMDIFDQTYNGLENVGKETEMYLKGSSSLALTGATWTLITKPDSSASVLGTPEVADTSTEFMVFTPDVSGTYKIVFADGGMADTITINAGLYLGMEGGAVACVTCHSATATKYMTTAHATAVKKQFDAMEGSTSHFGESCLECHTTGYNLNAVNDGFDDWPFVFPDTFATGVYDEMKAAYPDAMARADVQCEACHGPGSEHVGNKTDNKIVKSFDSKTCAACHEDNGIHHYIPSQWNASGQDATEFDGRGFHGGHAIGAFVGYAGNRSGCSPCHSGSGYVQWVKEGKPVNSLGLPAATAELPVGTNISCAVCHDPHDASQEHQLRLSDTQLGDGTPVTFDKYGTGAQCMECHRSRRNAEEYTNDPNNGSPYFGAHHGPQADMLIGANAPNFGIKLPSSPHATAIDNACVGCHMSNAAGAFDTNGDVVLVGGHSFNMNDKLGNDNVKVCEKCHGDVGTTFNEKKYYFNGNADHDGDGVAEGVQEEVHGMLEELATYLPQDADGNVDMSAKDNSIAVLKAGYAYIWVEEDRSFGIHNPAFTVGLLRAAIESMKYGSITAGAIQSITDIPMDQGYQVRLVWTAFGADDGIAMDAVKTYTILRKVADAVPPKGFVNYETISQIPPKLEVGASLALAGEMWDVVKEVEAIQFMEYSTVVPTLYNTVEGDTAWATFKVLGKTENGIIAETDPMDGYSTDDLAPMAPTNLTAQVFGNGVMLVWDKPVDKDFNFFEVYRSEEQGFIPSPEKLIATTTTRNHIDTNVEEGKTYYYIVTAKDFSENMSKSSNEVYVTLTDVTKEAGLPTEYALDQNYPNPFNPSTAIKFAIPEAGNVSLIIYDMLGNEVEVLVNNQMNAGYYTFTWNASNYASGIYFCQMKANEFTRVNKMLLIK